MQEKKNKLWLIIILAGLLVSTISVSLSFFSSQVLVTNPDFTKTDIKTATHASATMELGNYVDSTKEYVAYPGAKIVRTLKINGSCADATTTCNPVDANIKIMTNIDEAFGREVGEDGTKISDVEWTLYAATSKTPAYCKNTMVTSVISGINTFRMKSECKNISDNATDEEFQNADSVDFTSMKVLESGNKTGANVTYHKISVDGNTANEMYYLVVNYKDPGNNSQNIQQGKSFDITIDFELASSESSQE